MLVRCFVVVVNDVVDVDVVVVVVDDDDVAVVVVAVEVVVTSIRRGIKQLYHNP